MSVNGVDSRFFAAAPTVELDPRLMKLDQSALDSSREAIQMRELQQRQAQFEREQALREREHRDVNRRTKEQGARDQQRIELNKGEEQRRADAMKYEQEQQRRQQLEDAIRRARQARNPYELEQAKEELERLGIQMRPRGPQLGAPKSQVPERVHQALTPQETAQENKDLNAANAEADKTVSALQAPRKYQLPGISAPVLQAPPQATNKPVVDQQTSKQLDDIERRYLNGLQAPTSAPILPGMQPYRRSPQAQQSDLLLSPGDSLLQESQ